MEEETSTFTAVEDCSSKKVDEITVGYKLMVKFSVIIMVKLWSS
jgi:hypothetical protein